MHATDLLAQQHKEVADLLEQVRDASGEARGYLLSRLSEALALHATLEERQFYPLIRRNGFPEAADESLREHAEVKELLAQLTSGRLQEPEMELLLQRLEVVIRDHVDKEEEELFPWARARIEDADLEAAGEAMAQLNEELQRGVPQVESIPLAPPSIH